ncbi:MAG: hypothetical protein IJS38_02140 [Erysipelotrichaceae bacterium]|nr:hypothetical protein [Erysipelotrichaceae bacterium]
MKNMKSLLAVLLILMCFGCNKEKPEPKPEIIDDNYRNVYEIFVASFNDSNGDKKGDLNGVTAKLDYLEDMGYSAIWMMPIHTSSSYHKYDVMDYYSVDSDYGTLEDFDKLVAEAHKRSINIIIDLVVNHTSSAHKWFYEAKNAYVNGTSSKYVDYYNFQDFPAYGYTQINNSGKYYESRFVDTMPDLNLDSPAVREEIVNIMKFWLDRGVDGFRLDAVTSYYTGQDDKNVEFLSWLNREAKKIKEDCYIVGEAWTGDNVIRNYYSSGIDSFFHFSLSQAEGTLASIVRNSNPHVLFRTAVNNSISLTNGHIPAIFLDNHDTNRITGAIGRSKIERLKFVYGYTGMLNGCVYTYYGTEIGMVGSGNDENKRIAMLWDSEDTASLCRNPAGTTQAEYVYPGVKQQQKDAESLLNYHKKINYLRNKYPQIARGEVAFAGTLCTKTLSVLEKSWNDSKICILVNFATEPCEVDVSSLAGYDTIDYACINSTDKAELKSGKVTIPGYGIAILSVKK